MRVAIFSDVHGNLTALEAVLDHIDGQTDIDQIVFAGDLCLFGPRPEACIEVVRRRAIHSIVGNTDEWIHKPPPISADLDPEVARWRQHIGNLSRWTENQVSSRSLGWIGGLRNIFSHRISPSANPADDLLIVHANPIDLLSVIFPPPDMQLELYGKIRQDDDDLQSLLDGIRANVLAFGHLHIPSVRTWRDKTLVNVSSVSLPGDGDGRAKYAVLTWSKSTGWSVEHYYVAYPIDDEIAAFRYSRPPGWETQVEQLNTLGFVPQVV